MTPPPCPAERVIRFEHAEIRVTCDLNLNHVGRSHRTRLGVDIVIYWVRP